MKLLAPAQLTRRWIEQVVIRHELCPFARKVVEREQVRYCVSDAKDEEQLWRELVEELRYLQAVGSQSIETSLLIHPQVLGDFHDYLDFVAMTDQLIADMDLEGIIQIATFHPDYQFEGTEFEDPANYTNRAPFPMLHLLREESIEAVVALHPDPEGIPERNVALMRALGLAEVDAEREQVFEGIDME